jgi:hypothetical protein
MHKKRMEHYKPSTKRSLNPRKLPERYRRYAHSSPSGLTPTRRSLAAMDAAEFAVFYRRYCDECIAARR